ncbi:hypothetical protein LCGC14_0996060 [marine sediment metagenome]|uniref:Uncharacterized protein n=1 Tax=marine sediment metagenome TaxID=412755 RepID=A0A0F9N917_9ZZZZ
MSDEAKALDKKMDVLREAADNREYVYRKLVINVVSEKDGEEWTVKGSLNIRVSEELGNEDAVKEKNIEALSSGKSSNEALADVFLHLNIIPQQFGDAIFEEGFEDLLNEARTSVEGEDVGEAEVLL